MIFMMRHLGKILIIAFIFLSFCAGAFAQQKHYIEEINSETGTVDMVVDLDRVERLKNLWGDMEFDAYKTSADTTFKFWNSDGTYKANVDIEGRLYSADITYGGTDISSVFLKLDGSNAPLTGNLGITKADPEMRLTDSGDSEYSRWVRSDTDGKVILYNRTQKPGGTGALSFEGSDDRVTVADHADFTMNAFSIEFWSKIDDTGAARNTLFTIYDETSYDGVNLGMHDGKWRFYTFVNTTNKIVTSDGAPSGNWEHMIVSRDTDGLMTMTIDNVVQADTETNIGEMDSNSGILIGVWWNMTNDLAGDIDLCRFYNKALSSGEKTALYNSGTGLTGGDPLGDGSCIMALLFLDGEGTNAADSSGNNHPGTLLPNGDEPVWVTGHVPTAGSDVEVVICSSQDGVNPFEEGIQTYGDPDGRTVLEGQTIRFNIGGVEQIQIDASGNILAGDSTFLTTGTITGDDFFASTGEVGAPSFSFTAAPDTGMYYIHPNTLGFAAGGSLALKLDSYGVMIANGAANAPSYTFINDDDTGFYRIGADNIGITLGNSLEYDFSTTTFDAKSNDITTSGNIISTGGDPVQTGKFLTGLAGNTVFAFSGGNWDIRAGNGASSAQNVLRVNSSGNFDFYDGNLTTSGIATIGGAASEKLQLSTVDNAYGDILWKEGATTVARLRYYNRATQANGLFRFAPGGTTDMFYIDKSGISYGEAPAGYGYALNLKRIDSPAGIRQTYAYTGAGSGGLAVSLANVKITNVDDASDLDPAGLWGWYGARGDPPTSSYLFFDARATGAYNVATLKVDSLNRVGIGIAGNTRPSATLDVGGTLTVDGATGNLTTSGTISDGVLTISDGNITGMGNITGSDVDISAGTGTYTSGDTISIGGESIDADNITAISSLSSDGTIEANDTITAGSDLTTGQDLIVHDQITLGANASHGGDVNFYSASSGNRFFWDTSTASLSVGRSAGALGTRSVQFGYACNTNGGAYAFAHGHTATATGSTSFSYGNTITASGDICIAFGGGFTNSINSSFAVGFNAIDFFISSGKIMMPTLPTSDPSNAGELWNDNGLLTVSAG